MNTIADMPSGDFLRNLFANYDKLPKGGALKTLLWHIQRTIKVGSPEHLIEVFDMNNGVLNAAGRVVQRPIGVSDATRKRALNSLQDSGLLAYRDALSGVRLYTPCVEYIAEITGHTDLRASEYLVVDNKKN